MMERAQRGIEHTNVGSTGLFIGVLCVLTQWDGEEPRVCSCSLYLYAPDDDDGDELHHRHTPQNGMDEVRTRVTVREPLKKIQR